MNYSQKNMGNRPWFKGMATKRPNLYMLKILILLMVLLFIIPVSVQSDSDPDLNDAMWKEFDRSNTANFSAPDDNSLLIDMMARKISTNRDIYSVYYLDDANGDFVVEVEVVSQTDTDDDARAGIMVRNDISRSGDSQSTGYCILSMTPGDGVVFEYDSDDNGFIDTRLSSGSGVSYPIWLRLTKTGTKFKASYKTNPADPSYTQIQEVAYPDGVDISSALTIQDVGLFVNAADWNDRCYVEFEDFDFSGTLPTTTYTITASAGVNGAIDPSGTVTINEGVDAVFNIVPDVGYELDWLKKNGTSVMTTGNTYTVLAADVSATSTIEVAFKERVLTIASAVTSGNGTISPSGNVSVTYNATQEFTVTPDEGWEVSEVKVDGVVASLNNDKYSFKKVTANHTIAIKFVESAAAAAGLIPGCESSAETDYSAGFDAADFDSSNVSVNANEIVLQTGAVSIDPDNIIIPYEQEVAVTFLYEGTAFESDIGWVLKEDAVDANGNFLGWDQIPTSARHVIFRNIYDDDETAHWCCGGGDGILDTNYGNGSFPKDDETTLAAYDDGTEYLFAVDGDGSVTPKDMKKVIGTFAAGTEIVFFHTSDEDWDVMTDNRVFFTKTAWNPDPYGACGGPGTFTRTFNLGVAVPLAEEGTCQTSPTGWLTSEALTRLNSTFGVDLTGTTTDLEITYGGDYPHVIVGAPANDPDQWILGWSDQPGGGDADFNDQVIRIERQTGGIVTLNSDNAIEPENLNAYFTAVTFSVYDNMPGNGATDIIYYVSIDNGEKWVEITQWDTVLESDASKTPNGNSVTNWTPGSPQYTYRSSRIDFAGMGLSGRSLIWRASLKSDNVSYAPSILDVELDGSVASNGSFSRSSPIVKANVLYAGSYETADMSWTDKEMRGHLTAIRLYDPTKPTSGTGSATDLVELWDAGEMLSGETPSDRTIKFPNITTTSVSPTTLATGDGGETTFSGTLTLPDDSHIVAESVTITASCLGGITETFTDKHTDVMEGDKGGTGTIDRSNGDYSITFNTAPDNSAPIKVSYSYYTISNTLLDFTPANVTNAMLGIDETFVYPDGYVYDFDGNGSITENDGDWLADWIRGYKDGNNRTVKKEWLLGPVDHSVPALETPPGTPPWYFGSSVPVNERNSFDTFMTANATRKTVIYVGSRDGMIHAFYAGEYRHGNNTKTDSEGVTENRGYYAWEAVDTVNRVTEFDYWWRNILDNNIISNFGWKLLGSEAPNYGNGEELWSFIPDNLIARFKNNYLKAEDQSYVDASPALSDVYIDHDGDNDKEWRTVLLSAEGNGGDTIFCLDVTDPENPIFLWEFADPDLFRSRSSPAVGQIGRIYDTETDTAKWIAFFVSGKTEDNTMYPSIYMINIEDGSVIQRVALDEDTGSGPNTRGQGGVPSGQPAIIDADYNGYHDRMYIGTDKGFMYKVTLPDSPETKNNDITHCVINDDFDEDDDGTDEVAADQQYHPIYGSPVALIDNVFTDEGKIDYRIRIFFGTGDSPYYDENINTSNTTYHFFAYIDKGQKDECGNVELDWAYALPAGHRIFTTAFAAAGQIYFGTSTAETEDPCESDPANLGKLFALTVEGTVIVSKDVGNITTTPLVEDQHLYYITAQDGLSFLGSGQYNNELITGGEPEVSIQQWRIVE